MADTIEITGIEFDIGSSVEGAIKGIDELSKKVSGLASTVESASEKITSAFNSMASGISKATQKSVKSIDDLSKVISDIGKASEAFKSNTVKTFEEAGDSVKDFVSKVEDINVELDKIDTSKVKNLKNELATVSTDTSGADGITKTTNELENMGKMLPAVTNSFVKETGKMQFPDFSNVIDADWREIDNMVPAVSKDVNLLDAEWHKVYTDITLFDKLKMIFTDFKRNVGMIAPVAKSVGVAFLDLTHKATMLGVKLGKMAFNAVINKAKKLGNTLKKVASKALDAGKSLAKMGLEAMTSKVVRVNNKLAQLFRAFVRIATYRAIRSMIRGFSEGLQAGIQNMYTWATITNDKFKPAMDSLKSSAVYLKNSLSAMVSPILEALAPAFEVLSDKIVGVMNQFNKLFSLLTGKKTWTKATRQTQQWANVTSKSAKKATKAFEPFLLSIDELNRLPAKEKDTGDEYTSPSGDAVDAYSFKTQNLDASSDLADAIKKGNWGKVGEELAKKLNTITDKLDDWINNTFAPKAKKFATNMADFLNGFIKTYNWAKLGKTFADGLNALISAGQAFIERFDWSAFGHAIGVGVDSFIKNVDWANMGKTFGEYITGIFNMADSAISVWRKNAKTYGQKIADGLNEAIEAINWSLIGKTFADGINTVLDFANTVLTGFSFWNFGVDLGKMFDSFIKNTDFSLATKTFGNAINGVVDTFAGVVSIWAQNANLYGEKLGNAINTFFKTVRWGNLGETLSGLVNSMLQTGFSFFNSIDWKGNAEKLFGSIDTFLKTVDWTALANTFGTLLNGLFDTISVAMKVWVSNAGTYGKNIGNAINTFINKVNWNELAQAFVDGFNGIVKFLNNMISTMDWETTKNKIADAINTAITGIDAKGFGEAINELLTNILDLISKIDWYDFGFKIGQFLGSIDWAKALTTVGKAVFDGLRGAFAGFFDSAGVSALWQIPAMMLTLFGPKIFSTIGFGGIVQAVLTGLKGAFGIFRDIKLLGDALGLTEFAKGIGSSLIDVIGKVVPFGEIASTVSGGLSTAFSALTGVLSSVGGAFASLISAIAPFLPAILAVIAVITTIILVIKNWNTIVKVMGDVWKTVCSTASTVWNAMTDAISTAVNAVKDVVSTVWNGITGTLGNIWNGIKGTATTVFNGVGTAISGAWNTIKGGTETVWNGLKTNLGTLWNGIKDTGSTVFTSLQTSLSTIWNGVSSTASTAWNTLSSNMSTLWNTMKSTGGTIFTGLKDGLTTTWKTLSTNTSTIWSGISSSLGTAWNNAKTTASTTFSNIGSKISSVWDGAHRETSSTWSNIYSKLQTSFGNILSNTTSSFSSIYNAISSSNNRSKQNSNSTLERMKSIFETAGSSISHKVGSSFDSVYGSIKSSMKNSKSKFKSAFDAMEKTSVGETIIDNVEGIASDIEGDLDFEDAYTWGADLVSNFTNGIQSMVSTVGDVVTGIADKVAGLLEHSTPDEGPMKDDDKWMPDFMNNLINGIENNTPDLVSSAKNVASQVQGAMQGTLTGIDTNVSSQVNSHVSVDTGNAQAQLNFAVGSAIEDAFRKVQNDQRIVVNVDGREIFNAVVKQNDSSIMRTGYSPLKR